MFWFDTSTANATLDLPQITLAIGALGTAATGLVDTTKAFSGGLSRAGFSFIKQLMAKLYIVPEQEAGLPLEDVLATLRANWMNGMKLADQKSATKSLIKLQFNPATAGAYAKALHVDPVALGQVAENMANALATPPNAQPLTPAQSDAFGRFDLALTARIDEAYQRADQFYRNTAKGWALLFAVGLAYAGNATLNHPLEWWMPLLVGLIATPLAPVAKDISTAISTAAKALQSVRK